MAETLDLTSLGPLLEQEVNTIAHRLSLGILVRNIKSSPVDTGRFKNNWTIGIDLAPTDTTTFTAKTPLGQLSPAVLKRGRDVIKTFDISTNKTIYLSNNLPYAEPLATGTSSQAPAGWIDTNIRAEIKSMELSVGA